MVQTVFLDTNVILDYLENRDSIVCKIIDRLFALHEEGKIILVTSVYNLAEVIDKEFEIHFFSHMCLDQKMTFSEANSQKKNRRLFREVCQRNLEHIRRRIEDLINNKQVTVFPLSNDAQQYHEVYDLIYKHQLQSQDALIVATAFANGVTYFLSNDDDLTKRISDELNTYNLRKSTERERFQQTVLEAI